MLIEVMSATQEEDATIMKRAFESYSNGGDIEIDCSEALTRFGELLKEIKEQLKTAKLWIQFLEYTDDMKLYIRSERLGDWEIHLTATLSMLNLFDVAGHFHYAKSTRMYLQQILELIESISDSMLMDIIPKDAMTDTGQVSGQISSSNKS